MGPEPLIYPLAVVGLVSIVILAFLVLRARGRTWASLLLAAGLAFSVQGVEGLANLTNMVLVFFMFFGFFSLLGVYVLTPGLFLLRGLRQMAAAVARRFGTVSRGRRADESPRDPDRDA